MREPDTDASADENDIWTATLSLGAAHFVAGVQGGADGPGHPSWNQSDFAVGRRAIKGLFQAEGFAEEHAAHVLWRRDALGKPYVEWSGPAAEWAAASGRESRFTHVSNTHDGGAHLVIAAYGEELAGIGIDAVWLPRLRRPGKDRAYLLRFARQFMSTQELEAYDSAIEEPFAPAPIQPADGGHGSVDWPSAGASMAAQDYIAPRYGGAGSGRNIGGGQAPTLQGASSPSDLITESLRQRTAAHFSLMEAASKACGTGLKIGVGMGRATSLPKQSLGALRLEPEVELLFGPEARARLAELGAVRYEALVRVEGEMLVSVVALYNK